MRSGRPRRASLLEPAPGHAPESRRFGTARYAVGEHDRDNERGRATFVTRKATAGVCVITPRIAAAAIGAAWAGVPAALWFLLHLPGTDQSGRALLGCTRFGSPG